MRTSPVRFEEAVEETERLIIEAVKLRLVSDVPIGALLSGGIDSTLVCWALSKLNADVRAFTVGTPGDPDDESEMARDIARHLGIPHEMVESRQRRASSAGGIGGGLQRAVCEYFGTGYVACLARRETEGHRVADWRRRRRCIPRATRSFITPGKRRSLPEDCRAFSPGLWNLARPLARGIPALRRASNFLDYAVGGIGAYGSVRLGLPYFEDRGLLGGLLRGQGVAYRQVPASFASARRLMGDVFQFQRRMHFTSEFMTKVDGAPCIIRSKPGLHSSTRQCGSTRQSFLPKSIFTVDV